MTLRSCALVLLFSLVGGTVAGCGNGRATVDDCLKILERVVELESAEVGLRDRARIERKRDELVRRFAPDLARCRGLELPAGALECIATATSAEEVSHVCLKH